MKHQIIIALGSNVNAREHIITAKQALFHLIGPTIKFSPTIWTDAYGMPDKDQFLNCLVYGETDLDADTLINTLKEMEKANGRIPGECTIDADLLKYDDQRYHESDWERPYIKELLAKIQ